MQIQKNNNINKLITTMTKVPHQITELFFNVNLILIYIKTVLPLRVTLALNRTTLICL